MRRSSVLTGACAAVLLTAARAELPEARWLSPGADHIAALTRSPGECLRAANDPDTEYLTEVGRAAFKSPLLLGGQAARGGLSCASCHVDGRANPDFFLEGLSAAPGTADVSSSIFSKVRDDGVFNPVEIPSLIGIAGKGSFGTASPQPTLRAFIGSAILEEFQGAPTPPAVVDGLVAYINRMDAAACPAAPVPLTPRGAMGDVKRTLAAAREAALKGDSATADFLLVSAQAALGRIHSRFPGEETTALREAITRLAGDIGTMRKSRLEPKLLAAAIDVSGERAKRLGERLQKARRHSLYDPARLRASVGEE